MRLNAHTVIILVLSLVATVMTLCSCGNSDHVPEQSETAQLKETFSFFDVGVNTRLSSSLRGELRNVLGDDATQTRTVINLDVIYPGFLTDFFPEIEALNRKLNFPPRERVEHNTFKLMFRYSKEKNMALDYVEFLFSDYSKRPLMITAMRKKEIPGIQETLTEKYGSPSSLVWKQGPGSSLFWEKNGDILILSRTPDQFGHPTHHQVVILFPERIRELLETEAKLTRETPNIDTEKKPAF